MQLPLSELAGTFYNSLKSLTSGYATFEYEAGPFRDSDLVRLDFVIHGAPVDALTRVLHSSSATAMARQVCDQIKKVVDRQPFEVRRRQGAYLFARQLNATQFGVSILDISSFLEAAIGFHPTFANHYWNKN